MTDELSEQLEIIREMRALDEDGKPKHTQFEVAERLGVTQPRVSQLESKHNLKPAQISYAENNQENQEVLDGDKEGVGIRSENEGEKEGPTGRRGVGMSDESNNESDNDSDEWVCTGCGNGEFHEASEYLSEYKDRLDKGHIRTLHGADKVCANCGKVD